MWRRILGRSVIPVHHWYRTKMGCCSFEDLILCILALFLSPLAVLIRKGCEFEFCLNVILWLLGFIPGVIHAWFVILSWKNFERAVLTLVCLIGLSPIAVFFKDGCGKCFWVNVILWICGIIPGMIHGIWYLWFHKGSCF